MPHHDESCAPGTLHALTLPARLSDPGGQLESPAPLQAHVSLEEAGTGT